ncbi:MAG: MobA/MobL family protein [Oscillospiraceae bacterium]|nr:MobA/MobL family protein [Oscillospiraceae bacterium]
MANYHLEVKNISRGSGGSITRRASYIYGEKLHDNYLGKICFKNRDDVLLRKIFLPSNSPLEYGSLQTLCDEIDKAEKRYDARTAKEFIGSLPNELPHGEIVKIVEDFVTVNFIEKGLAAIAAIHEGRNAADESRNNPHAHILVTTRTLSADGFSRKKFREINNKENLLVWRERWAQLQNRAYERSGLDIMVSHECLKVQGVERIPTPHLCVIDWQREKGGEHTPAGDIRREVQERNSRPTYAKERERSKAKSR